MRSITKLRRKEHDSFSHPSRLRPFQNSSSTILRLPNKLCARFNLPFYFTLQVFRPADPAHRLVWQAKPEWVKVNHSPKVYRSVTELTKGMLSGSAAVLKFFREAFITSDWQIIVTYRSIWVSCTRQVTSAVSACRALIQDLQSLEIIFRSDSTREVKFENAVPIPDFPRLDAEVLNFRNRKNLRDQIDVFNILQGKEKTLSNLSSLFQCIHLSLGVIASLLNIFHRFWHGH